MKLPIIGIIIIVFLQLGFTAYNALDRPIGSLYVIKSLTAGTNPVAELPEDLINSFDSYDSVRLPSRHANNVDLVSGANIRKNRRQSEPAAVFTNTVIKIPAAKPDQAMLQFIAMQKSSDSAAIKYPQPMRPGGESENFVLRADRSSEKRSFISKSASVLRKPYDWIKALGSRIN